MNQNARETLLKIQTEMIYAALVRGLKLPDPVLGELFSGIGKIRALSGHSKGAEAPSVIEELECFFRNSTPNAVALRRMILDARPSQVKSIIRGYLVNYVYDW